jgi:GntR family transcriptional repressor for pyruvate dehydrogenase complex
MTTHFTPIPRQTVATSVRDAMEREIRSGALRPGSPLPSERELSEQFDVARTSIREAVQGLLSVGLVVKKGNRSYVVEHLPEVRLDGVDGRKLRVRELFTVRQILEPPITTLVAQNATTEQRRAIHELAERFHPDMTLEEFRVLDREFHLALAHACGNDLLAELSGKVLDSLFSSTDFSELLLSEENDAAVHATVANSVAYHHRIGEAIRLGDVERASAEITAHLDDVELRMTDQMT